MATETEKVKHARLHRAVMRALFMLCVLILDVRTSVFQFLKIPGFFLFLSLRSFVLADGTNGPLA